MKKISGIVFLFLFFFLARGAGAAQMGVSLGGDVYAIGDKFSVDIRVDSEGVSINAAQATLQFPKDILSVESVSKDGSVFGFWLDEPAFDNDAGTVSFIGGSTSGFNGKTLQVLQVNFKVKGSGTAELNLTDAAVTAADGSGTNVLGTVQKATVKSAAKTAATAPSAPPVKSEIIPPPVQITRPAVKATVLPEKSKINVPLYSQPGNWYNVSSAFVASWDLPASVSDVATLVDKNPTTGPTKSEGLFDNKTFPLLKDGIYYLHVRFKNNLGWGETIHYQIKIDTAPPLPFEATVKEGNPTGVPAPTIKFGTADQLSGIVNYRIRLGTAEPVETKDKTYKFPLLGPGKHNIIVEAVDAAGNITDSSLILDILPIGDLKITAINKDLFIGEGNLAAEGFAPSGAKIFWSLKKESGDEIKTGELVADKLGNFKIEIDYPLVKGKYFLEVYGADGRGARTFTVKSAVVNVRERPFLTIAGAEVTQFWFFSVLIVFILLIFGAGLWSGYSARGRRARNIVIARRDMGNACSAVRKDVGFALDKFKDGVVEKREMDEIKAVLERLDKNTEKMHKYLKEEIEEIK